ncbi:MAG: hypothetical protein IJH04_09430, partial [Eggerthellaceae bacterium]|nr:hypothetical protein [Eggerthellaceae bacterium]
ALFLESVGCGMLQGFLYSKPLALDMVIQHFKDGIGIPREPLDEAYYWDAISKIDLYSLSMSGGGRVFENESASNLPAGVLELRGGVWRFVRFNEPYREFLIDVGRVLETAAVFIGARIANYKLLGGLEYASTHDALTNQKPFSFGATAGSIR